MDVDKISLSLDDEDSVQSLDLNCSRLITEEDLIDSLFFTCDVDGHGKVAVSQLMEYIRFTTGYTSENQEELDQLFHTLDPLGANPEVNLATYRGVIAEWIKYLREKNLNESTCSTGIIEELDVFSPLSFTPKSPRKNRTRVPPLNLDSPHSVKRGIATTPLNGLADTGFGSTASSTYSSSSLNASITEFPPQDRESADVMARLAEAEHQNRRLVEESAKLRSQLETSEEISAGLAHELEDLRKQERILHLTQERLRDAQQNNEDLKNQNELLEETRQDQEQCLIQMDRERATLDTQLATMNDKYLQASCDLEDLKKLNAHLKASLADQKHLIADTQRLTDVQDTQLVEKSCEIEDLKKMLEEVNKITENLKMEKTDLEQQLNQMQQELSSLHSEDLKLSDVEMSDEDLMPVKLTPAKGALRHHHPRPSICSELKFSSLFGESTMPSPLCEKEFEDVFQRVVSPSSIGNTSGCADDLDKEVEAVMKSTASLDRFTIKTSHIATQFRLKKEVVMEQIQQLSKMSSNNRSTPTRSVSPQLLCNRVEDEIDCFAEKIVVLANEKYKSNFRIAKLSQALKKVKEQNQEIEDRYKNALSQLEEESQSLSSSLQGQLSQLREQLQADQFDTEQLRDELLQKEKMIVEFKKKIDDLSTKVVTLSDTNAALSQEAKRLESANVELAEKYIKSEEQMNVLQNDLDSKSEQCNKERKHGRELENSLTATRLERQLDLKELWRLVHKDVENECFSDSQGQDTPITVSSDSVRDQVAKEIQCLRSQLAKSQAALEALQTKTLPLNQSSKDSGYDWKPGRASSPSSPLVEALTLDFCDGNPSSGGGRRGKQGSASADDILDAHDPGDYGSCGDLHGDNTKYLATSCPHLLHKLVTSGTQTEDGVSKPRPPQIGATRYAVVNTSTGSSTSGVVDLDVSSGSNKSEPHGTTCRKSVLIVETACTPDTPSSPEDPNDPLSRHRTPSFKRAIERGPSGDSSNQSFETCDPLSTSPDLTPDRPELPPYPGPPREGIRGPHTQPPPFDSHHLHQFSSHLNVPDYFSGNYSSISSGEYSSTSSRPNLSGSVGAHSFMDPSQGDNSLRWDCYSEDYQKGKFQTSTPDTSVMDYQDTSSNTSLLDPLAADGRQSPMARRLSTLVEEGSDAEAEESIQGRGSPKPGARRKSPPSYAAHLKGRASQYVPHPSQPPPEPSVPSYVENTKTPPQYKAPPPYKDAVQVRRDHSPNQDLTHGECQNSSPNLSTPPRERARTPSPHRNTAQEPSKSVSSMALSHRTYQPPPPLPLGPSRPDRHTHTTTPSPPERPSRHRKLENGSWADKHSNVEKPTSYRRDDNLNFQKGAAVSRQYPCETDMSRQGFPMAGKDGQRIDLGNGSLADTELSEADKVINAQLIEEARKVSSQSRHKERRRRRGSGDLTRSQSFDQGEDDDDVFEKEQQKLSADSKSRVLPLSPSKLLTSQSPPRSPGQAPKSPKSPKFPREESDGEVDVKTELLNKLCDKTPPPTINVTTAVDQTAKPFRISATNVHLTKIREENLAKKRGGLTKQQSKMPELAETSETESVKGSGHSTDVEGDGSNEPGHGDHLAAHNSAFPSLPDETLKLMGLFVTKGDTQSSAEQLSEQEIEEKFASLSLAFKTDKLTLDKRIELHERSRDLAEDNIDQEMVGLKEAMKTLGPFCTDSHSRDIFSQIQHHLEVLEQSTSRVSSRAEVHGAVQQEMRMSKAIDVMLQHVENLKRLYEKEHTELEETKKIIQDNKGTEEHSLQKRSFSITGSGGLKQSAASQFHGAVLHHRASTASSTASAVQSVVTKQVQSTTAANKQQGGRRRASVAAFPRRLSNLGMGLNTSGSNPGNQSAPNPHDQMDPKSRFQNILVDTTVKTSVASAFRRASLEKLKRDSPPSLSTASPRPESESKDEEKTQLTPNNSPANKLDRTSSINEEEVFQRGFEEGIRAHVGGELSDLREQQTLLHNNLEQLMEQTEVQDEDLEHESIVEKIWALWPEWEKSGQRLRFTVAGFVFLMALFSVVFTIMPVSQASELKPIHYSWTSIEELVKPFLALRHHHRPPV